MRGSLGPKANCSAEGVAVDYNIANVGDRSSVFSGVARASEYWFESVIAPVIL
jgi:hypothetical protein